MTVGAALLARPMRVRPMEPRDISRVMRIANTLDDAPHWPVSAYQSALIVEAEPRRIALVAEMLEPVEPELAAPESDAMAPRCVVGFVVASLVAGEAELESIAVASEAQRRGIGGQLLGHLLTALKKLSVTRVNLEVRASNLPALALYRRHGLRETGRRVAYYGDPVEDAVLMNLDLGRPNALES
jgi:ribosomal-protein-alanine N-acetyltransferase